MAYFDTKTGSLEEAIKAAVGGKLDEERTYTVVHATKGKEVIKAKTSYDAAKKFAQMKGLKNTSGVDAHLMEEVELDEKFSPKEIKMAIGIASDKRYAGGNMTGAMSAIEKIKKGLSKDPKVAAVIKRQNEDLDEKLDPVNKTAAKKKFDDRKDKDIDNDGDVDDSDEFLHKRRKAISKAMSKDEGNKFTGALNAAKEKGEKTFVVSGRTYKVEDYNQDEAYKPVKSNHYDVKIQGVKRKDVNAILKYIKVDGGNYDIEDVDADQVTGSGMSSTSDGDIFIQGDDAGKLGMEIAKKFRSVKVMGEDYKKENYEFGTPERTKHTLEVTPGQSQEDWDETVGVMHKKNDTMREALAKMWSVDEGHNPFIKEADEFKPHMMYDPKTGKGFKATTMADHLRMKDMGYTHDAPKKENKTMTGKPTTKVTIEPEMKD
jgi:hypothetical protein